ncbi:MAG: malto-oligosyltrehalose trehalohydrolase [Steroidobacteraceae bacterium]
MPERRVHQMPFGAAIAPHGQVRFRLWAPAARSVELVLYRGRESQPFGMHAAQAGWFELVTPDAGPGTLYRYRIDGSFEVPDPASRFNPRDADGPSEVIDPRAFAWTDGNWRARGWPEAVLYELHVGTFSATGTFAGVEPELGALADLGINVIELMPVADFPGRCGWGYDGVLPYAPDAIYGRPHELKSLVAAAHGHGIAVMLDVVYNHFGPEGNALGRYAPQFFTERHRTPWGAAIDFDGAESRTVRDFFIHNALYWLEEYHLDGLRLDAVHAIHDDSTPHILTEIARAARGGPGRDRVLYLVVENDSNEARFLGPCGGPETFDAQWNDDFHHCLHVILTGESDGYYEDYAERPHQLLCRALAEGFAYQGEASRHRGLARGQVSSHLPPTAFVNFLQNHDQVGNRALGERIAELVSNEPALLAAAAILLLAPSPPLLFMGEEYAAPQAFPFFCDFGPDLAAKVREGRRREFSHFERLGSSGALDRIPDPTDPATARAARLERRREHDPRQARILDHYRRLLAVRRREIVPLIPRIRSSACIQAQERGALVVAWTLDGGAALRLLANLTDRSAQSSGPFADGRDAGRQVERVIFATHSAVDAALACNELEPWSVTWRFERGRDDP